MVRYDKLVIEIVYFNNNDVITASNGSDNIGAAPSTWEGWSDETMGGSFE